ncbi:tetratricopeptide repeat protein [Actinoplanes hulinensis]|uniref:Tetratricopeptide repeat protein n=1 Tax=Actinoplanes hulinensis TaxID=1144547 RepID=A0ABS7B993_9ACTN|nr:BTAD domain-containing putative transcriptional regulator [Actinoplanes hulinensis]MBW6437239.1 tetratricopeptide repeat protein [Actinoplanes hulinensis]
MLGPLSITTSAGQPVVVAPLQQRAILHVLLARANQAVSPDTLATALWGESAGQRETAALRVLIHHVRKAIGADRIDRETGGYVLHVAPGEFDAHEFTSLVDRAGRLAAARDLDAARHTLRRALGLWRGAAFQDDDSGEPVRAVAAQMEDRRLTAYEDLFELEIDLGLAREVCADVEAMAREHPLRERMVAQAMTALAGSGRAAEALRLFDRTRRLLADELGADPDARLRELHASLLTELDDTRTRVASHIAPAQLPAATAHFTARHEEVARLSAGLRTTGDGPALQGLAGMGGIGKTALAVKVGRRVAAAFPDGQLFVDLRGCEPEPADPGRVLGFFLQALGIAASVVPKETDDRAALFRSQLADRRVLVVLDNAANEAQVRPLLPAGAGCAALITSRARLPVLDGVRWTDLGLLAPVEGAALLHSVAGTDGRETEAAAEVVALCGRLPLAIRIAGARVFGRPHWTLERLAQELRDEQRRLDELAVGDLAVRGSLQLSYQALPGDAARLFRRLGLLGSPDFNAWVAGTLLAAPLADGERLLDRLVDAQMVMVPGSGPGRHPRYRLHDLVRLYAREQAEAVESRAEIDAALLRTWRALADLAIEADRRTPMRITAAVSAIIGAAPGADRWIEELLPDPAAWYDAERGMLIWAASSMPGTPAGVLSWQIPAGSLIGLQTRGLFLDWRETHRLGLAAAVAAGDILGEAVMRRNLAHLEVFGPAGGWRRGIEEAGTALTLFRRSGAPRGEVDALFLMSAAHSRLGEMDEALALGTEGLRIARATGDPFDQANLLHQVGWTHRMKGDMDTALPLLEEGLRLADDGGYTRLRIWLLIAVGIVHRERADLPAAEHHLRRALDVAPAERINGDIASILNLLATVRHRRGDLVGARAAAEEALRASRTVGLAFTEAQALIALGEIDAEAGELDRARELLADGRDRMDQLGARHAVAVAWKALGAVEEVDGRPEAAHAAWREARDLFRRIGNTTEIKALEALLNAQPRAANRRTTTPTTRS